MLVQLILIGDALLSVCPNLWEFLNVVSQRYNTGSTWIDALCTDQVDTVVRNHQTQQMDQIYQHAQGVLSWLGTNHLSAQLLGRKYNTSCEACKTLRFGKYWDRAWVTQEIALTRYVTVLTRDGEM